MPILMVALIALGAFGLIGILLATAVILETKSQNRTSPASASADPTLRRRAA